MESALKVEEGSGRVRLPAADQATVMVFTSLVAFLACAVLVDGFFDSRNLRTALVGGVPLAILGLAMALTIIGGTIDFSLLVTAVCSAEVFIVAVGAGRGIGLSLVLGALFAVAVGLTNGVLVAYLELLPLVVTIGTALFVFGLARTTFFGGLDGNACVVALTGHRSSQVARSTIGFRAGPRKPPRHPTLPARHVSGGHGRPVCGGAERDNLVRHTVLKVSSVAK